MTSSDVCHAYATEAFCEDFEKHRLHHHTCNGNHTLGINVGITMHYCRCGAEFYFIEEALKAVITKVFGNPDA